MVGPNEIIVTTTSNLEGWQIKKYLNPISAHLVAGTNLFSDFFASFTDVFGGRSQSYQRQISALYSDAILQLKFKAYQTGSNCIIGLSVDMDEVSGKGKSMFMITATGTPVIAENLKKDEPKVIDEKPFVISIEEINILKRKKEIIKLAETGKLELTEDNWKFIIENKLFEIFDYLMQVWEKEIIYPLIIEKTYAKTFELLNNLPQDKRTDLVYDALLKASNAQIIFRISSLIRDFELFNIDKVNEIIKEKDFDIQKRALIPILYDKPFYDKNDIIRLNELLLLINDTFKERGQRSMKKQMFSSKEKEVWTCECGKQNELDSSCSCGLDIYGFKINEVNQFEASSSINQKIEILTETL